MNVFPVLPRKIHLNMQIIFSVSSVRKKKIKVNIFWMMSQQSYKQTPKKKKKKAVS